MDSGVVRVAGENRPDGDGRWPVSATALSHRLGRDLARLPPVRKGSEEPRAGSDPMLCPRCLVEVDPAWISLGGGLSELSDGRAESANVSWLRCPNSACRRVLV